MGFARRGAPVFLAALCLFGAAPSAHAQWREYGGPSGWYSPGYQPSWQRRYQPDYPPGYQPALRQRDNLPAPGRNVVAKKPKKKETDKVERAVAPKGPLHIIVSIGSQRVKVYDGDTVIAEALVSTGTADHPTPTGVFSVIQKNRFHRSNIYSDAPMPFMQRLTWSGIALHEGKLPGYPASHGCIRLPADFAHKLWAMTRIGVRVIVAPNDVTPTEITHPTLFTRKLLAAEEQVAQLRPSIIDDGRDPLIPQAADTAEPVRTADAATTATDGRVSEVGGDGPVLWRFKPMKSDGAESGKSPPLRPGPVSVFVSRKEGRLFVRKGFATVFDVPVTIRDPQTTIGTHVLTAIAAVDNGNAMRWIAMTMPGSGGDTKADQSGQIIRIAPREPRGKSAAATSSLPHTSKAAQQALDRIDIPAEAAERIGAMLSPGASLIISDQGRGNETGVETDFVILTP